MNFLFVGKKCNFLEFQLQFNTPLKAGNIDGEWEIFLFVHLKQRMTKNLGGV